MSKISVKGIGPRVLTIRGQKVMLDKDLAGLYGVETRSLNQAVRRNHERFPEDFMFRLTKEESTALVSQNVIPKPQSLGGYFPFAFSEQGVAMLSSVLRSKTAIQVNIAIMRSFVKLRELSSTHKEILLTLDALECNVSRNGKEIKEIFTVIRRMIERPGKEPRKKKPAIGFK